VIKAIKERQRPKILALQFAKVIEWIPRCWDHSPANRPSAANVITELENAYLPHLLPTRKSFQENRKYFEINFAELDTVIKPAQRRIPLRPDFPGGKELPPYLPQVEIYKLFPPTSKLPSQHLLQSEKYDIRLFARVDSYFQRFYTASNPNDEAVVTSVDVIYNPMLEQQFGYTNDAFNSQFKGLHNLRGEELPTDLHREYLHELLISKNLVSDQNSNPVAAWHGAPQDKLDSICWYGLLSLASSDQGYYGKGIYLTQKPSYGEYYANNIKGSSLVLCWVLLGSPFPLTKVKYGGDLTPGYTSHYVLVKKKKMAVGLCQSNKDFDLLAGVTNYFPVEANEKAEGDEIVVFRSEQVLPRYIVHYTVGPKIEAKASPQQQHTNSPAATRSNTFNPQPKPSTFASNSNPIIRSATGSKK